MDLEKIMPLFRELSEDAKINWSRNCNKRAKKLADFALNISNEYDKLRVIQVEPNLADLRSKKDLSLHELPFVYLKKTPEFPWSEFHMAFCWNNIVLDPSYGEPVKIERYIPEAFELKNSPITEFMITKYFPDHLEHEKTILYDSNRRLMTEIQISVRPSDICHQSKPKISSA